MHARWRLRTVTESHQASYLAENGSPVELDGSDEAALAFAVEVLQSDESLRRVEAVSVGCPQDVSESSERKLVLIYPRGRNTGWIVEGHLIDGLWYRSLSHAADYAATATKAICSNCACSTSART